MKEPLLGERCQSPGWPGTPVRSGLAQALSAQGDHASRQYFMESLTCLSSVDLLLEGMYQSTTKGEMSYILEKELLDLNRISPYLSL